MGFLGMVKEEEGVSDGGFFDNLACMASWILYLAYDVGLLRSRGGGVGEQEEGGGAVGRKGKVNICFIYCLCNIHVVCYFWCFSFSFVLFRFLSFGFCGIGTRVSGLRRMWSRGFCVGV